MGFSDFHGNANVVGQLRGMLARDRFPHAVILSGPEGSGKFTLAQMVAKATNCLEFAPPSADGPALFGGEATEVREPDFCGHCRNCVRIAEADALSLRCEEAIEARENLRETDKKET